MNTPVFSDYARYYDLLYRDKDYASEARFVDGLLRGAGAAGGELLDVGCGTGMHAREFAALGWRGSGVDLSPTMIELARARTPAGTNWEFHVGAAADFDLGRRFSAVVSLFHVVSYQAGSGEAARMFANVRRHLAAGGLFLFDFWHGPGVLADPPAVRVQRKEDPSTRLTRIAEPNHLREQQRVDVNYEVFVEDRATGAIERIVEVHRMRYFFLPELAASLAAAGFSILGTRAALTTAELDPRAWHGLVLARAN